MEVYHLIHSFPMLTIVMVGLGNVSQVIEVDDVIIQRAVAAADGVLTLQLCKIDVEHMCTQIALFEF